MGFVLRCCLVLFHSNLALILLLRAPTAKILLWEHNYNIEKKKKAINRSLEYQYIPHKHKQGNMYDNLLVIFLKAQIQGAETSNTAYSL